MLQADRQKFRGRRLAAGTSFAGPKSFVRLSRHRFVINIVKKPLALSHRGRGCFVQPFGRFWIFGLCRGAVFRSFVIVLRGGFDTIAKGTEFQDRYRMRCTWGWSAPPALSASLPPTRKMKLRGR